MSLSVNALLHLCEVVGAKAWPRRFQPQTLKHCNKHGETVLQLFSPFVLFVALIPAADRIHHRPLRLRPVRRFRVAGWIEEAQKLQT